MSQKPSLFLEAIIRFLMPYFQDISADASAMRSEIIEALAAYATRTRAEMLNAAQIIAFGMTALDTLAEAAATEMSPSMRLRFRGCANGLNRSSQQNETTLAKRLACDAPTPINAMPEPVNDVPDSEVDAALQHAQARIEASRDRLSAPQSTPAPRPEIGLCPEPGSREERNKRLWASAMNQVLADMGMPNGVPPAT